MIFSLPRFHYIASRLLLLAKRLKGFIVLIWTFGSSVSLLAVGASCDSLFESQRSHQQTKDFYQISAWSLIHSDFFRC